MFNYEINTPCGKTMKEMLYKYHKKKCDICKGKNSNINMDVLNNLMKNKKGTSLQDLTAKHIRKRGNKTMQGLCDDIMYAIKKKNSIKE